MVQDLSPTSSQTIASYVVPKSEPTSGIVVDGNVFDLVPVLRSMSGWNSDHDAVQKWLRAPERLERLFSIPGWEDLVHQAVDRVTNGQTYGADVSPMENAVFLQPVHRPEKIICVGLNYRTHIEEAGRDIPEFPMLFAKYSNTLTGPLDDVPIPMASHRIDYEGELAVIVGRRGHRISSEDAGNYIAGYSVAYDVSARDFQFRTRQILQGKVFDKFCPIGPWVRRFDSATNIGDWSLRTRVNDEVRQEAVLSDLVFDVPFLIEYTSQILTLEPGDVILTGTPGGIGAALKPRRWLRDGDTCEVVIDHVGRIENRFVAPSP